MADMQTTENRISIRSYTWHTKGHAHDFYQVVLPLSGVINIEVEQYKGKVTAGECVVIRKDETHFFNADDSARFIVVDSHTLPNRIESHIEQSLQIVFAINKPLQAFLEFAEAQLIHQISPAIEQLMFDTFYQLLEEQTITIQYDAKIKATVDYINQHIAANLSIQTLASIACLSPTQFKQNFKLQTGHTVTAYITNIRMHKAQTLLRHTDTPLVIVAELVGYTNVSAFSRRFSNYFGIAPSKV